MTARAEQQIPGGLFDGLKRVWNGYSDHGRQTAQRIVDGNITPNDRKRFKQDEYARVVYMFAMTPMHVSSGAENLISIQNVGAFKETMHQIEELPEGEIDAQLRSKELIKLEKWGLVCRLPQR